MPDEVKTTATWGYSKDDAKIFDLAEGGSLPDGYYPNPAMVPGSDADKKYREDAEREGAKVPWGDPKPTKPVLTLPKADDGKDKG